MKKYLNKIFKSTLFKQSKWAVTGALVSKTLNFLATLYIAKLIGPENFGEFNLLQVTVGLFGTFSGLGLSLAATRLVAEQNGKNIEYTNHIIGTLNSLSLAVGLFFCICFFGFSDFISKEFLNSSELSSLLKISSLIIVFDSFLGIQNGLLLGLQAYKRITKINLLSGILGIPFLVLGAYLYGLIGLTIGVLLNRLVTLIVTLNLTKKILINKELFFHIKFNAKSLKAILKISLPSFLSSLSTSPFNWISNAIFVNQSGGIVNLGRFNAANQLKQIVLFLPDSAGKIAIPMLAGAFGSGDKVNFRKTILKTIAFNSILSIIPIIILFFFIPIFKNYLGSSFEISTELIISIFITCILIATTNAIGYTFSCSDLIWYEFFLRVIWGIIFIILITFYGKYNGAIGFSNSLLFAYLSMFLLQIPLLLNKFLINR